MAIFRLFLLGGGDNNRSDLSRLLSERNCHEKTGAKPIDSVRVEDKRREEENTVHISGLSNVCAFPGA